MFLIIILGNYVAKIPMPVLAGVMIVVCITQFDWSSFKYLVFAPKKDAFIMVLTISLVIYTHNLAIGVLVGVLVNALFFISELAKISIHKDQTTFYIKGPLFFASADYFYKYFYNTDFDSNSITIDFTESKVLDETASMALSKTISFLEEKNIHIKIIGLKND